ncbi:response regulator [Patescibacteria group bacterium]|nr:response regulator [Patescibacteria group bacterium]
MVNDRWIIIIEDDIFLSRLYQNKFSQDGWSVAVVDGLNGLKKIKQQKPTVILLDLDLIKEDGWQVLQSLKEEPINQDIPVVVLTNLSNRADVKKAKELGAVEFLIKAHFLPSEVVAVVNRQIKLK